MKCWLTVAAVSQRICGTKEATNRKDSCMSSAMVFLMRNVDTARDVVNSLIQFWINMDGRPDDEVRNELSTEWRRLVDDCDGDQQAAIEFLAVSAIAPFTDVAGVLIFEDRKKVRPRVEMLSELDMEMDPHNVQYLLDLWKQFAPDDDLQTI
jgi:hypothetical protein